MTITAKFPGTCKKCGGSIGVGMKIEWERGAGARHEKCPDIGGVPSENLIDLSYGSGYGGSAYEVGKTYVIRKYVEVEGKKGPETPEFVTVISAWKRYYREDGFSFGVGDEQGYVFFAKGRPATPEEISRIIDRIHERALTENAERAVESLKKTIRETGEVPAGENAADGDRLLDSKDAYGAGDWFVISPEHIWYVKNNGMDGDDWSRNNVRTGGAGAIGWRIPKTGELESMLRTLAKKLAEDK